MQVNTNYDAAVRQYTQAAQTTGKAGAAVDSSKDTAAAAAPKQDVDQADFSKDTAVTGKMSSSDRAALVQSLKADLDNQMSRFTNMMTQMFQKQGITANLSQGNDFWRFMASGNYTVDAKTKADAQAAISEDGYWGVAKTSQRIFDFEMQAAVEKGFKQAEEAWGGSLPAICGDTHSAIGKLFDDYYAQRGVAV